MTANDAISCDDSKRQQVIRFFKKYSTIVRERSGKDTSDLIANTYNRHWKAFNKTNSDIQLMLNIQISIILHQKLFFTIVISRLKDPRFRQVQVFLHFLSLLVALLTCPCAHSHIFGVWHLILCHSRILLPIFISGIRASARGCCRRKLVWKSAKNFSSIYVPDVSISLTQFVTNLVAKCQFKSSNL